MGKGPLKGLGLCRFLPSPDRKSNAKASLAVQWLRRRTFTARGHGFDPQLGTKIPKMAQCSPPNQKKKNQEKYYWSTF